MSLSVCCSIITNSRAFRPAAGKQMPDGRWWRSEVRNLRETNKRSLPVCETVAPAFRISGHGLLVVATLCSVQDGGPLSSLLRPGLAAPGAGRGGQVGRWRGEGGGLGGECLHRFLDISGPEASMATSTHWLPPATSTKNLKILHL